MSETDSGDQEAERRPQNPFRDASLWSQLTFSWPLELIQKGLEAPIQDKDIPELLPEEDALACQKRVEQVWEEELELAQKRKRKPRLYRAVVRLYVRSLWKVQPLILCTSASRIGQALALGRLVALFEVSREETNHNYTQQYVQWAGILIACACVPLVAHHQTYFRMWRFGMQIRVGAVGALYAKSLKVQSSGKREYGGGELLNLASNDVERFIYASLFFSYLFWAPVEAILVLAVGMRQIGIAFAAGYCVLLTFVPLQFWIGKKFAKYRSAIATITDQRVSLISQAIQGIRVMKMNGWELQFAERIRRIRKKEVQRVRGANGFRALNEAIFFVTSVSVSLVIFVVHINLGNAVTPTIVFTTFSLINLVQFTMTKFFAFAVMSVSECVVSMRRIQNFLELSEVDAMEIVPSNDQNNIVKIEGVSCHWDIIENLESKPRRKGIKQSLQNLVDRRLLRSMKRQPPQFNSDDVIVEETDIDPKEVDIPEDTAEDRVQLAEAQPLSRHQRSRRSSFESASQRSVALENISLQLEKGRLYCIIGPVGCGKSALLSTLAGELKPTVGTAQRSTASIAFVAQSPWIMNGTVKENILLGCEYDSVRYQEIIDACALQPDLDMFIAGDATLLGDRGIQCSGGQRARIGLARALYTDAEMVLLDDPLSAVDAKVARILFEKAIRGLCVSRGKCVVLATHQYQLIEAETCILMKRGGIVQIGQFQQCASLSCGLLRSSIAPIEENSDSDSASVSASTSNEETKDCPQTDGKRVKNVNKNGNEEGRSAGQIAIRTWKAYFSAMGGAFPIVSLLVLFMITQASLLFTIAKIGRWSELPADEQSSCYLFNQVLVWVSAVIAMSLLRSLSAYALMLKGSSNLHDRMTLSVLRANISFFDTSPLGRILNRFSSDVGSNDDQLPASLSDTFSIGFMVLGGVITAAVSMPFVLIVVPPIVWYFIRTRRIFLTASREIKRLVGVARSPVFAQMSESMQGVATIRANNASEYFLDRFAVVQNDHSRTFFAFIACTRWLNFRLEAVQVSLVSTATLLAVTFNATGVFTVDPSVLGLALTLLLQMSGLVQWAVRQSSEALNHMVAVERVAAYGEIPSEPALYVDADNDVDANWPSTGSIEIKQLQVRYRESLPPALTDLSLSVNGGERVGICGRTGSGKSTLLQALFRLLEPEEGCILLDGVDISKVGLHKLRKNISVIPQTPFLFSDWTLRDNLDPFSDHTVDEIEDAISKAQLDDVYFDLPDGLDTLITDDGCNFSVGQRQLLCTARAILKQSKYLVLDEPTAHVDTKTDEFLQRAIDTSFSGATILAIAHRLETIIEYDKILVIGKGKRLEYGAPDTLLENEGGYFSQMVAETGDRARHDLHERASIRSGRSCLTEDPLLS